MEMNYMNKVIQANKEYALVIIKLLAWVFSKGLSVDNIHYSWIPFSYENLLLQHFPQMIFEFIDTCHRKNIFLNL